MQKMKKMMAVALSATMVVGSAVTAFGAPGDVSDVSPTGKSVGSGTSEGHVDREILNVVLPTETTGAASPFSYTMDPERLIQETEAARYEDFTFPEAADDTGVYFRTDENAFGNSSKVLKAINQSSCNVTIAVTVQAKQNSTKDIALATSATPTETAPLYLALTAGGENKIVSTRKETITKTIAGTPSNFETSYDETDGYAYTVKDGASTWKAMDISMTGKVANVNIAADTTAPDVEVTWGARKALDSETVSAGASQDYTAGPSVTLSSDGVVTMSGLTAAKNYAHSAILTYDGTDYQLDRDKNMTWGTNNWDARTGGTLTFTLNQSWLNALNGKRASIVVTLTDNTTISCNQQF